MATYTFRPPDEERHHPAYAKDPVLSKFSTYRQGLSVVTSAPGVYVTDEYIQPALGWVEGVDYFVGGHIYDDVSQDVADDLTSSGYASGLTENP